MTDRTLTVKVKRFILEAVCLTIPLGIALPSVVLISPSHASETPLPASFAKWCEQQFDFGFETSETINALLSEVGTTDCRQAALRLQAVYALNLNSVAQVPAAAKPPILSYLQLNLPSGAVDLRPVVAAMPNLRILDLSHTFVPDLAPLQQLAMLEDLTLAHTGLSDLTPLTNLSSLVQLDVSSNQVQDLSPLAGLNRLQRLDFSHNAVSNLSVLEALPRLNRLGLANNPIDLDSCGGAWADACDAHSYLDPSYLAP